MFKFSKTLGYCVGTFVGIHKLSIHFVLRLFGFQSDGFSPPIIQYNILQSDIMNSTFTGILRHYPGLADVLESRVCGVKRITMPNNATSTLF